jgi:hypothetical protein
MVESILLLKLHRPKKHKLQHRLNCFWVLHICKIEGLIFTYKLWIGLNTTALSRLKVWFQFWLWLPHITMTVTFSIVYFRIYFDDIFPELQGNMSDLHIQSFGAMCTHTNKRCQESRLLPSLSSTYHYNGNWKVEAKSQSSEDEKQYNCRIFL